MHFEFQCFFIMLHEGKVKDNNNNTKQTLKDQLSDEQCLVLGGRRISDFVEGFEGALLQI